jgi:hypothetical protein
MTYKEKRIKVAEKKVKSFREWIPKVHPVHQFKMIKKLMYWEDVLDSLIMSSIPGGTP